jgi:rhomboid protease GluP
LRDDVTETHLRFRDALPRTMRREWVTDALLAINIAIFGWMVFHGVSPLVPDALEEWGANKAQLTLHGEPWRLVSSMFVHAGLIHLGFNMYFLMMVGRLVERLYGHLGFALLYAFAGMLGSMASALVHPDGSSVGASGALFGALGALGAFLLRRRKLLPGEVLKRMRVAVITTVLLNIGLGLSIPGIDNAAHVGGLVGGFVAGLVLAPSLGDRELRRPWILYPVVALACAGIYVLAWTGFRSI